jgi:AraC-like DNA-binding protein
MKSQFENVGIPKGCSIRVLNRRVAEIPFEWHHHPEWELTLTLNSRGSRFIADNIGKYDSHDLVLIPPEMSHTWASAETIDDSSPHVAIVVWFTESWALKLADACPEFSSLRQLLRRATGALSFPVSAGKMLESNLPKLLSSSAGDRVRAVLDVLTELAETDAVPLATPQTETPAVTDESTQLKRILAVLHERFAERIRIRDLCAAGNISERSLHRLFVRHMGENLTDYLCRLRIGRACMWLVDTDRKVSAIAADAGFSNVSNFNRRFRAMRQMSPMDFRRLYTKHCGAPDPDEVDLTRRSPSLERTKQRDGISGSAVPQHVGAGPQVSCGQMMSGDPALPRPAAMNHM